MSIKCRTQDLEIVAAYAKAGATLWLENIHPWRFGWDGGEPGRLRPVVST